MSLKEIVIQASEKIFLYLILASNEPTELVLLDTFNSHFSGGSVGGLRITTICNFLVRFFMLEKAFESYTLFLRITGVEY